MSDFFLVSILTLDASVRICVPLIFASMAGLFAERSGVVDIGLEGKLLMSAFIAASAASGFGSPWLGLRKEALHRRFLMTKDSSQLHYLGLILLIIFQFLALYTENSLVVTISLFILLL